VEESTSKHDKKKVAGQVETPPAKKLRERKWEK
jgi:hypothetical protein